MAMATQKKHRSPRTKAEALRDDNYTGSSKNLKLEGNGHQNCGSFCANGTKAPPNIIPTTTPTFENLMRYADFTDLFNTTQTAILDNLP